MRRRRLLELALLAPIAAWASACMAATPAPEPLEEPLRVLLLGDSISIGYTPHVQRLLAGRAEVLRPTNEGGGAQNCAGTTNGVEHVDEWLAIDGGGWDVIHFNFGLHDLKRVHPESGKNSDDPADPRQAEPRTYRRQLDAIVTKLDATGARLVFATTTPVPAGGVRPHRDPQDVERYNDIALEVMARHGVAIDDLYGFALARVGEIQQPVNVHFTPEGSEALGVEVARSILAVAGLE